MRVSEFRVGDLGFGLWVEVLRFRVPGSGWSLGVRVESMVEVSRVIEITRVQEDATEKKAPDSTNAFP